MELCNLSEVTWRTDRGIAVQHGSCRVGNWPAVLRQMMDISVDWAISFTCWDLYDRDLVLKIKLVFNYIEWFVECASRVSLYSITDVREGSLLLRGGLQILHVYFNVTILIHYFNDFWGLNQSLFELWSHSDNFSTQKGLTSAYFR